MLKGIPAIISPDLLKIISEMGHGDEIVIADGNFPAASHARRLVRADGHNVPALLEAITNFFPIDTYGESPITLMQVVQGDKVEPVIWEEFQSILEKNFFNFEQTDYVERSAFYDRAKSAYAIVATSEKALYANLILRKGVVTE